MSVLATIVETLLRGVAVSVEVTILAGALMLVVAFIVGLSRLSPNAIVRTVASFYVEVLRGTSALVVMFWFYFALPLLLGTGLSALTAGVIALGLSYGAYAAEVVRGAVLQVPRGQWEAALAVNMTPFQRMVYVILPQAVVAMLPPLGNLLVDLLKATSLVSLITLADLTFQARVLQNSLGHTTEVFLIVLCMYFVLSYILSTAVRWFESRASHGQEVGRVQVTVT
jgi:polar amino acid transport system permease protein